MTRSLLPLAALGSTLLLLAGLGLLGWGIRELSNAVSENGFVALLVIAVLAYLAAVRLVLRDSQPRAALWVVLGLALMMRAVLLPLPPLLSSDMYRYVWDGRVQAAGINPYLYIPADPALEALRDNVVYPHINRATYARTVYPPMAEAVFAAVGMVWSSVTGMKLAAVGSEMVALCALIGLLRFAGLPPARVLIYAWNPLAIWAFAGSGHVDAFAVGLLALALLFRARNWHGVAGAILAAATLVKFFPAVVAAAFLRQGRFWRPVLAGAGVVAVLYAAYLTAGRDVLGFLPAYGSEEGFSDGSGFWLLAGLQYFIALPTYVGKIYIAAAAAALLTLCAVVARGSGGGDPTSLCQDTAVLAGTTMVVFSPHYAWYYPWLAVPCVVAPVPAVVWLSAASALLYVSPFNERFFWPALVYAPAILLAAIGVVRRRASPAALPNLQGTI
jgi:alpha-1,6-mannosyltransferase